MSRKVEAMKYPGWEGKVMISGCRIVLFVKDGRYRVLGVDDGKHQVRTLTKEEIKYYLAYLGMEFDEGEFNLLRGANERIPIPCESPVSIALQREATVMFAG